MGWVWGKGSGFRAQPASLVGEPHQGRCLFSGAGPGTAAHSCLQKGPSPLLNPDSQFSRHSELRAVAEGSSARWAWI